MDVKPPNNPVRAFRVRLTRWSRKLEGTGLPADAFNPRRWFLAVVWILVGIVLGIALLTYTVDPYQVYRKPTFYHAVFDEAYYSIPGITRHYSYDSIVVGSSMCQNFAISDLQRELGGQWVKLTPSGCRPITARLVMETAFAEKPIRRVLLGLDEFGYENAGQHLIQLPEYLYDRNPWNDYRYLLNKTVLTKAIPDVLRANLSNIPEWKCKLDADRMWNWDFENGQIRYGCQAVLDGEKPQADRSVRKIDRAARDAMPAMFQEYLLDIIRTHRQTEFVIFYPPYSVLAWYNVKHRDGQENLQAYLDFKRMTMLALLKEPNVKLFDFQADREIIDNFDNYKDCTHYSPVIGRILLHRISRNIQRVTPQTVENGIAGILAAIQDYGRKYAPASSSRPQ